ncbi:photoreceptor ankyrin repeat protein isoform X2 [Eschrichtius robustus]|uniref:photoreceptor ankyrin repeat protein isoform X2 n=1 Tax=Eschrichtius robustus TaxID=9764 RepID=UPI0035C17F46
MEEEELTLQKGGLDVSEALSRPDNETFTPSCTLGALYWACFRNDTAQLQAMLDDGVSPEEATQTGLMVACYHGFQSVVALLSRCPFLDVNQQDKEGDTALMLAAQAGHVPLVSLLINYYAGLDLERRDQRGLTALMKAAMRDRSECVAALLMAGADLTAVDPVRGKTALEWAFLTDSFDTVQRIQQLLRRPQVEQLSHHYQPEWPALPGLVAQAQAQAAPSFLERLQATLSLPFAQSPQEGGVLDHLVTVTTSLASPFLTTACHTLCPDHPPALGTRSKSVPELLGTAPPPPPVPQLPQEVPGPRVFIPYQSPQGVLSMCHQWLQPRDSTSPRPQAPKILLSKAPSSGIQWKPEPRSAGNRRLSLPVWRYQELRMERRRQEEARLAQSQGTTG